CFCDTLSLFHLSFPFPVPHTHTHHTHHTHTYKPQLHQHCVAYFNGHFLFNSVHTIQTSLRTRKRLSESLKEPEWMVKKWKREKKDMLSLPLSLFFSLPLFLSLFLSFCHTL